MEVSKPAIKLSELPIGARLLYRSKTEWRFAVLSRLSEEKATMIVCSPSGRTYRLSRDRGAEVVFDGAVAILKCYESDTWRENFSKYDCRW
ncbi:MAG: hypothetical protein KIS76_03250 [Pyrinomonadaceae bacterium]|nr:hypothetical protein [Pyrinomonadaceae bacterium]